MNRILIISLISICLLSCIGKPKKEGIIAKIPQQPVETCNISTKPKLFLSFWYGMSYKEFYCVTNTLVNYKELTRDEKGVYFNIENDNFLIEPSFSENDKVLTKIMLEYQISPYPRLPVKGQPRIEGDYIHPKKVKDLQDGLIKSYGEPLKEKFTRGGIIDIESFKWHNNSKLIIMETTLKELLSADGENTEQFYVTKLVIKYFDKTHYELAGKEYKSYEKIKRDRREKQMRKL